MTDMKFTADLGNGYFLNPVMNGDYSDPTVIRDGDDYFMTHSTGRHTPSLIIWHSRDLVNWEPLCVALEKCAEYMLAPELVKYNGKYYIYYPSGKTNWVITADRPEGPWSRPVDLHVGNIDPGHIATPEGERYLYLSDGYAVGLTPDGLALKGVPRKVYDGWQYDSSYHVEGFFLESPKLFYRNGYYYIVSAQGGTAGPSTAHMAVVARSRSPLGPWENSPYNPLVHTFSRKEKWWAKGHGTVLEAADKSWWIVYHAYEKDYLTHGRKVLLEPVEWTDDGWFRIPEGINPEKPIKKPAGNAVKTPPLSDDFLGRKLGLQWRFFGKYDTSRFDLTGNCLRLKACGNTPGESSPMTCMTGDYAYEVSVEMEINGNAAAGLILFYDPEHYCGIGLESGEKSIRLYKYGKRYIRIPYESNTIHFKLVNDHHDIIPYYSFNGHEWKQIDFCFETSGFHHNAFDGYYSLRPGVFACGGGYACIRNFIYRGLD